MRKTTSLGFAIGARRRVLPAGVEADEAGAAIGKSVPDAMHTISAEALALGDHVGT